jgi:hypothetical protein
MSTIADKIDQILADDRNFSTRTGLRFTLEVLRDATNYIEKEKERTRKIDEKIDDVEDRLVNVENNLKDFLAARKVEQEKAEGERAWYRHAVIGGIISIFLSQLALYFLR